MTTHLEGHEDLLAVQQGVDELRIAGQVGDDDAVEDLQHDAQEIAIHLQLVPPSLAGSPCCHPLQPLIPVRIKPKSSATAHQYLCDCLEVMLGADAIQRSRVPIHSALGNAFSE